MKNKSFKGLKYLLLAYLLVTVVVPVGTLFATIRPEHGVQVFQSAQFLPMLKNSLITASAATFFSIVLSFSLAFALNRSRVRFKSAFVVSHRFSIAEFSLSFVSRYALAFLIYSGIS